MAESHWLNFYLSCGGNVFVFLYSVVGRSTGKAPVQSFELQTATRSFAFPRSGVRRNSACTVGPSLGVRVATWPRSTLTGSRSSSRTFSTLSGLSIAGTKDFTAAPCYKVMIGDPKGRAIPDVFDSE